MGAFSSGSPAVGVMLLVVGLAALAWNRLGKTPPEAEVSDGAASPSVGQLHDATPAPVPPPASAPRPQSKKNHRSPAPTGRAVESWAPTSVYTAVVGEAYRDDEIRSLFRKRGLRIPQEGRQLDDATAHLEPDPTNPFDRQAVSVWVDGCMVGFLAREAASEYHGPLSELAEEETHLAVPARVWAMPRHGGGLNANVVVWLPPARGVQSFNAFPDEPYHVLPRGKSVQVTREEDHMEVLTRYVSDHERYLAVTLHLAQEAKTERSTPYEAVEVRLMGERVGVLTKAMSAQLRDLVAHVAARGRVPVCRATLRGSPLRAEVTLQAARSTDVTRDWLEDVPLALPQA